MLDDPDDLQDLGRETRRRRCRRCGVVTWQGWVPCRPLREGYEGRWWPAVRLINAVLDRVLGGWQCYECDPDRDEG